MSELFYTCVIIEINTEQQYQMFRGKHRTTIPEIYVKR